MKTPKDSLLLAREMVEIGTNVGRKTMAVVSNMDEPLGYAVGNSLEVIEAINTLNGEGPKDLLDLCITLGSYMVVGAGKADSVEEAGKMLKEVIDNKAALHKLAEMVKAQKGDERAVYDISLLPKANLCKEFVADSDGYVERIICDTVGLSAMVLGGGRETKESTIDLSVGIMLHKKTGDYVKKGESVATFYANDESKLSEGMERFSKAYIFTDKPVAKQKLIRYIVTDSKVTENE